MRTGGHVQTEGRRLALWSPEDQSGEGSVLALCCVALRHLGTGTATRAILVPVRTSSQGVPKESSEDFSALAIRTRLSRRGGRWLLPTRTFLLPPPFHLLIAQSPSTPIQHSLLFQIKTLSLQFLEWTRNRPSAWRAGKASALKDLRVQETYRAFNEHNTHWTPSWYS